MATDAQSATFDLDIDSDALTESAEKSAKAIEELGSTISSGTKELKNMQQTLRLLRGGGAETAAQAKSLSAAIKDQKLALAQTTVDFVTQGGVIAEIGKKAEVAAEQLEGFGEVEVDLSDIFKDAAPPLEKQLSLYEMLSEVVGGKTVKAYLKIGLAIGAVTAAVQVAIGFMLKYTLASADARRNELLRLEGLTKVRNWWGIAAGNAKEMQASLDRVSESTAGARDETARYQQQLYQAGLRGAALDQALEAMSITASTQGEEQAQVFAGWATAIGRTGGSVKKLSDDVKARLGGIAARQMLSLTVLTKKFGEVTSKLFDGLDLEPLGKAVQGIVKTFSQSTASGRALKTLLTSMLSPFVKSMTSAAKTGRAFFLGMIYGALKLESAILAVLLWWKKTFGMSAIKEVDDAADSFDHGAEALWGLVAAFIVLGPIVAALSFAVLIASTVKLTVMLWALVAPVWANVVAFGAWVGVAWPVIAFFGLIIAAVVLLGIVLYQLYDLFVNEIDWKLLGKAMWEGITGVFANVTEWFSNLGHSIAEAFRSAIGAHSPSRVFASYGEAIGDGLKQGIEKTKPEVNASVKTLVEPLKPEDNASVDSLARSPKLDVPRSGGGSKQAPVTIDIGGITIAVEPRDGEGAEGTGQRMGDAFVERITSLLRTVNDQLGGGEVAT